MFHIAIRLLIDTALVAVMLFVPATTFAWPRAWALLAGVLATGFLGVPAVASLDRAHWHLRSAPTHSVGVIGLALFILGWALKSLALHANAFAVAVVRPQPERRQIVADTGVYRVVRHPFYAADPLIFVGLAIWLESYAAAAMSTLPVAFMVGRLLLEERFLLRELPGYAAYAKRVPFRLIPRVW